MLQVSAVGITSKPPRNTGREECKHLTPDAGDERVVQLFGLPLALSETWHVVGTEGAGVVSRDLTQRW